MHLVAIGGSDGGISAALRARELDPPVNITVLLADAYPNFSICGIPYLVSGDVNDWHNLAHRTRSGPTTPSTASTVSGSPKASTSSPP